MMNRTSIVSTESLPRLKPESAGRKARAKHVPAAEAIVIAIVVVAAVEGVPAAAREATVVATQAAVVVAAADVKLFIFLVTRRAAAMRPFTISKSSGGSSGEFQKDKRLKIVSGICRTPLMM